MDMSVIRLVLSFIKEIKIIDSRDFFGFYIWSILPDCHICVESLWFFSIFLHVQLFVQFFLYQR